MLLDKPQSQTSGPGTAHQAIPSAVCTAVGSVWRKQPGLPPSPSPSYSIAIPFQSPPNARVILRAHYRRESPIDVHRILAIVITASVIVREPRPIGILLRNRHETPPAGSVQRIGNLHPQRPSKRHRIRSRPSHVLHPMEHFFPRTVGLALRSCVRDRLLAIEPLPLGGGPTVRSPSVFVHHDGAPVLPSEPS